MKESRALPGPWLVRIKPCEQPRLTLICFPFGGAGAGSFWEWGKALADDIELWAVRLPGRESRSTEEYVTSSEQAVACIVRELKALRERKIVFYGHSMGAGLAYQTAMALRSMNEPLPELFIASGRMPPHKPYPGGWGERPDKELLDHVIKMGGIPAELSRNESILSLYLPKIRADFRLNENLFYGRAPVFDFPITLINGVEDPLVQEDGLEEWREHTRGAFKSFKLPGGHFFLQSHAGEFLKLVANELAEARPHLSSASSNGS
ncbi:thioesterase [Archangium violaceum]|uniref:thioesterase II family protein n=1 Tax=Archangium violaceum TaxID=83451 RepID=UPI002B322B39|nr:thioesterase [Archangium violaceum]